MITYSNLQIQDVHGAKLGNTFMKQEGSSRHLALLFPGLNYGIDAPLLYFPRRLLAEQGADVLSIETNYGRKPEYAAAGAAKRAAWVEADARAALQAALSAGSYEQITLVGKSIGTRALAVLAGDPRLAQAKFIWLTPLLNDPQLVEVIRRGGRRGLLVIGTADSFFNAEILAGLAKDGSGRGLVITGADHSIEIPGDFWGSFHALQRVLEAVAEFLEFKR